MSYLWVKNANKEFQRTIRKIWHITGFGDYLLGLRNAIYLHDSDFLQFHSEAVQLHTLAVICWSGLRFYEMR